ncbi:hypothetical protein, partial [Brunnivagina elsteri]|uniref:hypothetical protein n=1 Tax=Brunnivagina elsteri TaxID=1247191 RepID=UPI0011786173
MGYIRRVPVNLFRQGKRSYLHNPRGDNPNKVITIFILPGHPSHNFLTMRENEIDPSPKSRSLTWEHHKQSSISTEKSRETRSQG